MSKFLLSLGLVTTIGSGVVVYDHSVQSAKTPGGVMDMMQYAASLQGRVVDLMEPAPRPRIANLPQADRKMSTASFSSTSLSSASRSTEDDINDFVKDSPQLQAMVKADRAQQKASFWARIRQKVTGSDDAQSGNRLAAFKERNRPRNVTEGIDPAALANMTTAEILANREGIAQHAKNMLSQDFSDF